MDELEKLRRQRMQELMQQQSQQQMQQQIQEEQIDGQIKIIISQILTPQARERLGNIRTARPEFARQIEVFLIQLAQGGKLPSQVTDEQLKEILGKLQKKKRETKIIRR